MDIYYLVFILPAVIITLWAQIKVKTTFNKYAKIYSQNGITAYDAVRKILDANGLTNVVIEHISGSLTDHYDPKERVIRLSDSVYSSMSVASIGVAAHEAGHAIQHAKSYAPLALRNTVYPVVNISSQAAIPLIFIGFLINSLNLVYLGIILFSAVVLFQLITLPVEFNASGRALKILKDYNILSANELGGAKRVLSAAAMTYVASALVAAAQLLRFVLMARRRD
ncbi:MAG: zinc metallopeptidase [Oscillospiraceae bacterium]|nr:zinc metallopeptidase [Oscillospiraceae bacterium]